MSTQIYEKYWRLTNAFTDYHGEKFISTLKTCVNFIDKYKLEVYSGDKYQRLQLEIQKINPITLISIRKSINQLVKLGFIHTFLTSYNPEAIDYLQAKTNKKREILLSKIVYSNFSANRAVKNEDNNNHLSFLIKTLIDFGNLTKDEIIGLMLVDVNEYIGKSITKEEIELNEYIAIETGFYERKYNQVNHFCNLLGKLDELIFVKDVLYFEEDAKVIFGDDLGKKDTGRDKYLHTLYKNDLKEECEYFYGKPMCVLEKLPYPVLIASHIKPFVESSEEEAYDPNNGLLLSRTIDSLFDLNYISFTDNGQIIFSSKLENEVKEFWKNYTIDEILLNDSRKSYLEYHRSKLRI